MTDEPRAQRMPRGLRDTRTWYREVEPMSQVDPALVEFVAERAGARVLDVGCGLGGYSRALALRGFDARGLDVVEEYVNVARELGVEADHYDGGRIPLDDNSVDTVILIEVIEHLEDPGSVLAEAARVTAGNVLVTTPNCTQSFDPAPIEFSHMLDLDHRQLFTVNSLRELMAANFERSEVTQSHPIDELVVNVVMPRPLPRIYRTLARAGRAKPRFFSRLLGQGWVGRPA